MRIALVNSQYFMVGGTTRYLFNVERLLTEHGHTVVPFANRYQRTIETPYLHYFVDPPGGPDAPVYYRDSQMTVRRASALFVRGVYDLEVRRRLERMIKQERIDLVYSINICNFLGPSVIDAARRCGIPYVLRLSDFNLSCPAYLHLRNGKPCEDCRSGLWNAVRHRCLQDSFAVSLARVLAMWTHRLLGIYGRVDRIIAPSAFLRGKLLEMGFEESRVLHIPTFVDLDEFTPSSGATQPEIVYTGRIAREKGPDVLVRAAALLPASSPVRIVFVGDGDADYVRQLRAMGEELAPGRLEFTGFLDTPQLRHRVASSTALALPSRCFENMPNSVTEAMALAKPILASRLGSLPEQVVDDESGLLLDIDEPEAWTRAIERLVAEPQLAHRLGAAGRLRAEAKFSPQRHLAALEGTFAELLGSRSHPGGKS